jgi:hypothetical protein
MSRWALKNVALRYRKALRHHARELIGANLTFKARKLPAIAADPNRGSKFAIVAIVKNEQDYIAEWLEFYLLLGAARIIVYDNGSTDRTADIIGRFASINEVTLVPWCTFLSRQHNKFSIQALAYAHALTNFGSKFRWMAFLDVDEFLFPTEQETLADAFQEFLHLPSLSIPWTNFGPSGHLTKPSGLVIENYTECSPHPLSDRQVAGLRYKTIVDPSAVTGMGTHFFPLRNLGAIAINEAGYRTPVYGTRDLRFASSKKLQLNHYFTRSLEEMREREAKGRVGKNGRRVHNYLERRLKAYAVATANDDKILRFVPALKERLRQRGLHS